MNAMISVDDVGFHPYLWQREALCRAWTWTGHNVLEK